jgi:hypothetical protein
MKTKLLLACLAVVIAAIAYADLVEVHATGSPVPEGKVRITERSVDRATIWNALTRMIRLGYHSTFDGWESIPDLSA